MTNIGTTPIIEVATGRDVALNWDVLVTPGIPTVSTTRCWSSIRIGSIREERSGLRRARSNRNMSKRKERRI